MWWVVGKPILVFSLSLGQAEQKPSKKAKNTAGGTNILPQKAKVLLYYVKIRYISACQTKPSLFTTIWSLSQVPMYIFQT